MKEETKQNILNSLVSGKSRHSCKYPWLIFVV